MRFKGLRKLNASGIWLMAWMPFSFLLPSDPHVPSTLVPFITIPMTFAVVISFGSLLWEIVNSSRSLPDFRWELDDTLLDVLTYFIASTLFFWIGGALFVWQMNRMFHGYNANNKTSE